MFVVFYANRHAEFAEASDVQLDSDTSFHAYEVRGPRGGAYFTRSRLTQNVAMRWTGFFADEPDGERALGRREHYEQRVKVSTVLQLRLDHDFGQSCLVGDVFCGLDGDGSQPGFYQPFYRPTMLDAPNAYLEVSNLPGGVSFRAGRMLWWNTLGIRRLDGARFGFAPASFFESSFYLGSVVRANSVLGSETFSPQGPARLDVQGLDEARAPYLEPNLITWIAGSDVHLNAGQDLRLSASVRQLWEGSGIAAKRAGLSVDAHPAAWLNCSAAASFDLVDGELYHGFARADADFEDWGLNVAFDRRLPRFDWGSIWAWFQTAPISELSAGGRIKLSADAVVSSNIIGRYAELEDSNDIDVGTEIKASFRTAALRWHVSGFAFSGNLGPVSGLLASTSFPFHARMLLRARASLWQFDDPFQDVLEGVSVSESLGMEYRLSAQSTVLAELNHAANRVVSQRLRALLVLKVEAWR
ncbi:MAG: hypothetical protein IPJ88_11220 [Myxococcales bacterium]|nr:MAG: hypothetical protein IPJ88_11220 [Myxococcales bacterium]